MRRPLSFSSAETAVDRVLTMAESAVEALRVLHELAGEIVEEGDE